MFRTYIFPLVAIAGVLFAVVTVIKGSKPQVAQPPVIEPPRAPYASFVAGSGIVEASSQNIAIGSPIGAVVMSVDAKVGDTVKQGAPLFSLDSRDLKAEFAVRSAAAKVAQDQLSRMEAGTRPELIPTARAKVAETQALLADAQKQLAMWEGLTDPKAVSADELSRRRFAVQAAQARADQAKNDLALLEAGSWDRDKVIARSQLEHAQALAESTRVEIERRTIRSPIDGRVLQVNTRVGEFAPAGANATPLMLVGAVDVLHVRIDIDENDAWRVRSGAKAVAYVRGNKNLSTPLTFVRFEPFVVPKRSLTGDSTERVDTRVLQVIYSFDPKTIPVFVGQQMDVYIDAPPLASTSSSPTPTPTTTQASGSPAPVKEKN